MRARNDRSLCCSKTWVPIAPVLAVLLFYPQIAAADECFVVGNEFENIVSPDGCCILLKAITNRATVVNNTFGNLSLGTCDKLGGETGAVLAIDRQQVGSTNCRIVNNDYTESGLTGIGLDGEGLPFVTLNAYSEYNLVNERRFPDGVSSTDTILINDLGTNNRVIDHR